MIIHFITKGSLDSSSSGAQYSPNCSTSQSSRCGKKDKTNKILVMKGETYLVSMEEQHKMDKEIDKKEVNKIERNLNKHSKSVVKIFNVGDSRRQDYHCWGILDANKFIVCVF